MNGVLPSTAESLDRIKHENGIRPAPERRLCIVAGGEPEAAAALRAQLVAASAAYTITIEEGTSDLSPAIRRGDLDSLNAHRLDLYDAIRTLERRAVDAVLLPSVLSHIFLDELRPETSLPILDMLQAVATHLRQRHPTLHRLGVLTSEVVRRARLFERRLHGFDILHADRHQEGSVVALAERGAELILLDPNRVKKDVGLSADAPLPILDVTRVYAEQAVLADIPRPAPLFRVGIVGGVGPAATVDFIDKIVRNTPARRDQDHLKLIIHHNPQIPDRTENLVGNGPDPTVALYAACKRLDEDGADIIAIPCNTAHAFLNHFRHRLRVPIISMPDQTTAYLRRTFPERKRVGLLATTGMVRSGIYHRALTAAGLEVIVPNEVHQALVMEAIAGTHGVKAGFTDGRCRTDLLCAIEHIVRDGGAEAVVLGCTELPLIAEPQDNVAIAGHTVTILDPTEILARRCIALARTQTVEPG